jgi:hypothetical protein
MYSKKDVTQRAVSARAGLDIKRREMTSKSFHVRGSQRVGDKLGIDRRNSMSTVPRGMDVGMEHGLHESRRTLPTTTPS